MFTDETRAALINHLHRRLLDRDAPADELAQHLRAAADLDDAGFSTALIDQALFGPESQTLFRTRLMSAQGAALRARDDIDIVSLGANCVASDLLLKMGVKKFAMPFDWVFSAPGMVAHAIRDSFATFLDPRQFRFVPPESRRDPTVGFAENIFYLEHFGVANVYAHHDPVNRPEDLAYYHRAVVRFLALPARPTRKLFVLINPHVRGFADCARDYEAVAAAVRDHCGGVCLFIDLLPGAAELAPDFQPAPLAPEAGVRFTFRLRAGLVGITFADPVDALVLSGGLAALLTAAAGPGSDAP